MEQEGKPTLVKRQGRIKEKETKRRKEALLLRFPTHNSTTNYVSSEITSWQARNNCLGDSSPRHQPNKPELITRRKAKGKLIEKHREKSGAPRSLQPFVALWRKFGGNKHLNEDTKSFRTGIKRLRLLTQGKMFDDYFPTWKNRKFTIEEFETSLMSFDQAKVDSPALNKFTLDVFILNNFTKRKSSLFLEYLIRGPEKYPILTRLLITYYRENVLGDVDYLPHKSTKDKFIEASNRLGDFFEMHRDKISPGFIIDKPRMIRWLFEAVQVSLNGFEDNTISPGHLCSDLTFNERLPKFLVRQAIFKDRHTLL